MNSRKVRISLLDMFLQGRTEQCFSAYDFGLLENKSLERQ